MNTVKSVASVILILFLIACSRDNNPEYQLVTEFDPQRDAEKDIEMAVAEAQRSKRNILHSQGTGELEEGQR